MVLNVGMSNAFCPSIWPTANGDGDTFVFPVLCATRNSCICQSGSLYFVKLFINPMN